MNQFKKITPYWISLSLVAFVLFFFWFVYPVFPNDEGVRFEQPALWMMDAWTGDFMHGWAVPVLFVIFVGMKWRAMAEEEWQQSRTGLLIVFLGILLFLLSVRTLQPRVSQLGIPFLIFGGVLHVCGWKIASAYAVSCVFLVFCGICTRLESSD